MRATGPWRTIELELQSDVDRANPYLDLSVIATFRGPHGAVIRRPAFWDGGRTWRVRFTPTQPGAWHYVVTSSDPVDRVLNTASGTIRYDNEPPPVPSRPTASCVPGPTVAALVLANWVYYGGILAFGLRPNSVRPGIPRDCGIGNPLGVPDRTARERISTSVHGPVTVTSPRTPRRPAPECLERPHGVLCGHCPDIRGVEPGRTDQSIHHPFRHGVCAGFGRNIELLGQST